MTRLTDRNGDGVEITDFAPRFQQFGRIFRPTTLMRIVRPFGETPRIRIRLRPVFHYGAQPRRSPAAAITSAMSAPTSACG